MIAILYAQILATLSQGLLSLAMSVITRVGIVEIQTAEITVSCVIQQHCLFKIHLLLLPQTHMHNPQIS